MNMPRPFPLAFLSRPRPSSILLGSLLAALALAWALAAPAGSSPERAPRASSASRSRGPSYMTGISDTQDEMFGNPLWQQLHTRIVRADRFPRTWPCGPTIWSRRNVDPRRGSAPPEDPRGLLPLGVHENEDAERRDLQARRGEVHQALPAHSRIPGVGRGQPRLCDRRRASFVSPTAMEDAQYYQALKRDCVECTVIGLDVLDNPEIDATVHTSRNSSARSVACGR